MKNRQALSSSKKAQIKFGETIAIVVVFIVLVFFGLIFFGSTQKEGIQEQLREKVQLDAVSVVKEVSNMPELHCSIAQVEELNCIDITKFASFKRLFESDIYGNQANMSYIHYFGDSKIYYTQVYPAGEPGEVDDEGNPVEHVLWDNHIDENTESSDEMQVPVVLHNPVTDRRAFGILFVKVYSRSIE